MIDHNGVGIHLLGGSGTALQQEQDAKPITIGEARMLVNAVLNDFVKNHLHAHMVPCIEHYIIQMPRLIDARIEAYEQAKHSSVTATPETIQ